jgi:hypothetical protein
MALVLMLVSMKFCLALVSIPGADPRLDEEDAVTGTGHVGRQVDRSHTPFDRIEMPCGSQRTQGNPV